MYHICNRLYVTKLKQFLFYNFTVDKNGDVCISILHEPGEDKYGYEKPEERWLPIHTVETIMISVISMLADPNGDSPANVDAAVRYLPDSCCFCPLLF
jgi:ubiquitin-protein ligase